MVSRADRSPIAQWWWTVDRFLLVAVAFLMVAGIMLSFATSPAVAARLSSTLDPYHFVKRQALFLLPAITVLIGTSFLDPREIRRLALAVLTVGIAATAATLVAGSEMNGSTRWLSVGGFSFQPSEFVKPAYTIIAAWLFAENLRRPDMPGTLIATGILALIVILFIRQPDVGQTILICAVWGALLFLAGLSWIWIGGLAGIAVAGLAAAYATIPHVTRRVDGFLRPGSTDTYQVDTALRAFIEGGWFGRGPGEGMVKRSLPDSHTDFVFAVAAEEFGILFCLVLLAAFTFIVARGFWHARRAEDPFERFAIAGLTIVFGVQAAINMAVNLHLMPAKGMTLPFVSYGGSSLIAIAFTIGMLLALTRRRPQPIRFSRPLQYATP